MTTSQVGFSFIQESMHFLTTKGASDKDWYHSIQIFLGIRRFFSLMYTPQRKHTGQIRGLSAPFRVLPVNCNWSQGYFLTGDTR